MPTEIPLSWCTPLDKKNALSLREVVLFGVLGALTFALQVVMGPLPNIDVGITHTSFLMREKMSLK